MLTRNQVIAGLAAHYSKKLGGKVWAGWDDEKRAYYIQGEGLPPHPDLKAQFPNGWSLLDYIKPTAARTLLASDCKCTPS